jgi:3-hydroxyisobutyrate dehydrogenase-like beta-hydroxyacid dehydrogenase
VLWCPHGRSTATTRRAEHAGLQPAADLPDLLNRATVVLSICPPAAAEDIARHVAGHGYDGIYIDANAINPERVVRIADILTAGGARVLDAAIFGPPPTDTTTVRLYLAGPHPDTAAVANLFTGTGVHPVLLDAKIGTASGLKLAHSSYQKAARALAGIAHALAADLGVTHHLITEAEHNSRSPLTDPEYLPSVAARAWRWAPEMREVADTLTAAALPPELALAAATVLDRWTIDKDSTQPLPTVLEHLHEGPR